MDKQKKPYSAPTLKRLEPTKELRKTFTEQVQAERWPLARQMK